jgi:hypothetical protein
MTRARLAAAHGMYQDADGMLQTFIEAHPGTLEAREASYWRAIMRLEASNAKAERDEVARHLDEYLADTAVTLHESEARIIRRLISSADSLAVRHDSVTGSVRQAATAREEELKKEIQALKEQLEKTNAELERIRRRLGSGRP